MPGFASHEKGKSNRERRERERASEHRGGGGEAEGGERGTLTDDAQPRSWGRTAGSSRMAMPVWLSADGLNTDNYLPLRGWWLCEVLPRAESKRV